MRFTYIAAWSLFAGARLPDDAASIGLFASADRCFTLTREPNRFLEPLDRGAAISRALWQRPQPQTADDLKRVVAAIVEEAIAERQKGIHDGVLVFQAHGEVDTKVEEAHCHGFDDFVVCTDAVDQSAIEQRFRADEEAMKLALSLEATSTTLFTDIARGVCLQSDDGTTIFNSHTEWFAELVGVTTTLGDDAPARILARYRLLQQRSDLERIQRLHAQMSDHQNDRLKTFLSGWAALEIVVAKAFKTYERGFLESLASAHHPALRERFIQRVGDVMHDKYRLSDKFVVVSVLLFPDASDSDLRDDCDRFLELKGIRDSVYHGDDFTEKDLPVHDLAQLLRKYLLGYVGSSSPRHVKTPGAPAH